MTDNQNARFEDLPVGAKFETLAPEIFIAYNPIDESGSVAFNAMKYLRVDGVYREDIPGARVGSVTVNFADILARQFAAEGVFDPVTGSDLSEISGAGLVVIIKAAFDTLWNEKIAAESAAA